MLLLHQEKEFAESPESIAIPVLEIGERFPQANHRNPTLVIQVVAHAELAF